MTKFEFLRKALFANEREDVAFRSVDELMRRPIVRVTLEDRGDKGQRLKLIRDKKHARLIDLDESHLVHQAALLNDQTAALLNNNQWMADATLMNCIEGVKSVHWIIDAIELYRRIEDSPDDEISEQRVRDVENRIVQYEKTLHVIRSFRHTHEKDFENYVVTGIWHRLRLANLEHDLKPITQQYVKRENGYALLDLYFPDIKFAVECDEAYHQGNYLNDQAREREVYKRFNEWLVDNRHFRSAVDDLDAISAVGVESNSLELARVDASLPYGLIDRQLDEIVNRIKNKYRQFGCPCWDVRPAEDIALQDGQITVQKGLVFDSVSSIFRGMNIRTQRGEYHKGPWQHGGYPVANNNLIILWFPHLAQQQGRWLNILSEEGKKIKEMRGDHFGPDASRSWKRDADAFDRGVKSKRIVFAQSRNGIGEAGYRFMGVYQMDGYGERDEDGAPTFTHWEKVADAIKIYNSWNELVAAERPRDERS